MSGGLGIGAAAARGGAGAGDPKNNGRELAVEALLDMHVGGPSHRVKKIKDDFPALALSSRPIQITQAMLLEQSNSLSKYETKGDYLDLTVSASVSKRPSESSSSTETVPPSTPTDGYSTPKSKGTTGKDDDVFAAPCPSPSANRNITSQVRERVLRHHAKIVKAKNTAFWSKFTNDKEMNADINIDMDEDKDGRKDIDAATKTKTKTNTSIGSMSSSSSTVTAHPPSQLVSSLRKIYGIGKGNQLHSHTHASDAVSLSLDQKESSASVNILPGLLQSIFEHEVMVTTKDDKQKHRSGAIAVGAKMTADVDGDRSASTNANANANAEEGREWPRQSVQNVSPVANIETIVGNALAMEGENISGGGNGSDSDRSLQGLIVAALSVLTTCILEHPMEDESNHDSDETLDVNVDKLHNGLQVSGPLSLAMLGLGLGEADQVREFGGEGFELGGDLIQYFLDASSIYEERIEIQTASILAKARKRSEACSNAEAEAETETKKEVDGMDTLKANAKVDANIPVDGSIHDDSGDDSDADHMPNLMQRRFGDDMSSSDESMPFSDDSSDSEDDEEQDDSIVIGGGGGDNNGNGEGAEDDDEVRDMERPLLEEHHSSSDSESDDDADDDDDDNNDEEEQEREEAIAEEAHLLEEALAMSLAELNSAISAVAIDPLVESGEQAAAAINSEEVNEGNPVRNDQQKERDVSNSNTEEKSEVVEALNSHKDEDLSKPEESIPLLPTSPDQSVYKSLWDRVGLNIESEDGTENISRCMDPSTLGDFGKLPPSNILLILLQLILTKVERRKKGRPVNNNNSTNTNKKVDKRRQELESMLREFSIGEDKANLDEKNEARDGSSSNDHDLHLIIASIHILANARLETFDHLCVELLAKDGESPIVERQPSWDDEYNTDDPAFAINSDNITVTSAFETLEEKGMVRKAAAAAHTAAIRREKQKQKVIALRQMLHMLSTGSYMMLRCLRLLLQDIGSKPKPTICPLAKLRLSTSITTFTSSSIAKKCNARISKLALTTEDRDKFFDALLPKALMIESASLWGECVPNLITCKNLLDQQIRHLFDVGFGKDSQQRLGSFRGIDRQNVVKNDLKFPWCEMDEHMLKLSSLCKRMRSADALDIFIPRPSLQVPQSDDFHNLSDTLSIIGKLIFEGLDCSSWIAKDIEHFFYSLCHRYNAQVISWDGALGLSSDVVVEKTKSSGKSYSMGSKLRFAKDPDLLFDSAKCSDSIAILPSPSGACSINQRAHKVWGTVLSTKYFNPRSGVHRWAVKLDKCERGHIFIGVGTARTSMKTYVGGDKNGWGVIGTQALWHDRKKIRSDYGRTFRTGATIVVTLDTDAGTLGFSLWNENDNSGNSQSPQKLRLDLPSPNESDESGMLEDWGIAFEGLPLDTRLFPAVGMYQRDDKATLIGLEANDIDADNESNFQLGRCFFPQGKKTERVRQWNSDICDEGIIHASNILNEAIEMLTIQETDANDSNRNLMFKILLPSIASSITSFPSTIPILSGRFAFNMLPNVIRCIDVLGDKTCEDSMTGTPNLPFNDGRWTIKAAVSSTSASGVESFEEEYVVTLESGTTDHSFGQEITGNGTGTAGSSKNKGVSIHGSCTGNLIHFVERWFDNSNRDPSVCTVEAKLNLDGTKFEGKYHNAENNTSGMIIGMHENIDSRFRDLAKSEGSLKDHLGRCSYLLGSAASHLALILDRGAPTRDLSCTNDERTFCNLIAPRKSSLVELLLSSPVLSRGFSGKTIDTISSHIDNVHELFRMPEGKPDSAGSRIVSLWHSQTKNSLRTLLQSHNNDYPKLDDEEFNRVDALVAPQAGGNGSLSSLDSSFRVARKSIIKVLLHHSGKRLSKFTVDEKIDNDFISIWSSGLQIVETKVRNAIMKPGSGQSRVDACQCVCNFIQLLSSFLLEIAPPKCNLTPSQNGCMELFQNISTKDDILYLRQYMEELSQKRVLKLIGLSTVRDCLNSGSHTMATRETMLVAFYSLMDQNAFTQNGMPSKSTFSGSSNILQEMFASLVKNTFHDIEKFASELLDACKNQNFMDPTMQSSVFAMYLCFLSASELYEDVMNGEILWDLMKSVSSLCINELRNRGDVLKEDFQKSSMQKLSKWMLESSIRYTNLKLLETSVSLLHTSLFRLQSRRVQSTRIESPLSLLKEEILNILRHISDTDIVCIEEQKYEITVQECAHWNDTVKSSPLRELESERSAKAKDYISIVFPGSPICQIRSLEDYFCHILNVLSTVMRAHDEGRDFDITFLKKLISFVVQSHGNTEISSTSRRFRIRIIRLLRMVLPKCAAEEDIISSFVHHVMHILTNMSYGKDSANADNKYIEAKETVSLIRYLFSVSDTTIPRNKTWREIILKKCSSDDMSTKASLHVIFGGLPGLLVPGSFVLLKSPAAKNLQPPSQLKSGSEPRSVGLSLSPVAGGGIEGIISGLCRNEAKGGIICKIDESSSTCEVILLDREDYLRASNEEKIVSVRAVRVPLSDISAADENGLLLDESFPVIEFGTDPLCSQLVSVLSDLSEVSNDGTEGSACEKVKNANYSSLATFLRCNISILSTPSLLHKFVSDEKAVECLSRTLQLASLTTLGSKYAVAQTACAQSLKALPEFEARYWHVKRLDAEIKKRRHAITSSTLKVVQMYETLGSVQETQECTILQMEESKLSEVGAPNIPDNDHVERERTSTESGENDSMSGSNNEASEDDDDDNDAGDNAGTNQSEDTEEMAHMREAAIVQMLELGLPRSWSEYALRRVGGANIEAAVHFCLERGGDMERLLAEDHERSRGSTAGSNRRRNGPGASQLLQQLVEMGFPSHWCTEALAATGQNVDEALTWILTNGERLSALDEGNNDADDDSEDGEGNDSSDDETNVEAKNRSADALEKNDVVEDLRNWPDSIICPVRSISGKANIDVKTLDVSGNPSGGFSSVGTKGVLLTEGKWYYECVLVTAGCIQVGWADSSFSGHCQADRGDGCGDGPSSWAYDGWRRYRWHNNATEWGCRWQEGDIVGCLVDMDQKEITFTLNGRSEEVGMGLAFSTDGFKPCGGVYACVSFNRKEKVRLVIGGADGDSFHFSPPSGYKGVGEAVISATKDLDCLLAKERTISSSQVDLVRKPYLCDFSDTEHGHEIFAWQHRYYGSDASVHLGIGRNRHTPGTSKVEKSLKSLIYKKDSSSKGDRGTTVDLLLTEVWRKTSIQIPKNSPIENRIQLVVAEIKNAYEVILAEISEEFRDVTLALSILYARKAIMHIAISMSSAFDLSWFCVDAGDKARIARQFMTVLELCCSLSSEGWVGEAGTMSMASEALGLAISSNERMSQRNSISSFLEASRRSDSDSKKMEFLISGATTQILTAVNLFHSSAMEPKLIDPSNSLAACAECVLGGEGVGAIIFIKNAIRAVVMTNESIVDVILAYISRSIRLLSNIEFLSNDSQSENMPSTDSEENSDTDHSTQLGNGMEASEPDARLISFLSGLLISGPIQHSVSGQNIANALLEAWTMGLLAPSVPWRMISAMTISSLLNSCPRTWDIQPSKIIPLRRVFQRLNSIISRRIWAERAALPIYSRYLQSLIELQSIVSSFPTLSKLSPLKITVDAATPSPLVFQQNTDIDNFGVNKSWEAREGWVCSDTSWEVWTGAIEYFAVDWTSPSRSAVRSLMDGGEGPPFLREGCTVLRGLDWGEDGSGTITGNEDGKETYDVEKSEREKAKKEQDEQSLPKPDSETGQPSPEESEVEATDAPTESEPLDPPKEKKKKLPLPKLPLGRVISIEPWKGVPGAARRVRWDLTGEESIYRYGGDGGRFDIVHVEVNDKSTRVVKRHPHSETAEQCAARHGFGASRVYNVLLRIRKSEMKCEEFDGEIEHICDGILEVPDFGAGIEVACRFHEDGAVTITEGDLIFGSKDSGWEARFGQPTFLPGTTTVLSATSLVNSACIREDGIIEGSIADNSNYEELLGSSSFPAKSLRNRANGGKVRVASEMRLIRSKYACRGRSSILPPLSFDNDWHAPSLLVSRDQRTVTCLSAEGRTTAFFSTGFSKGVHYWEIKIEQADVGSVYVGVAEKPKSSAASGSSPYDSRPRLNRWLGWGFVNFRATYNEGSERVYGSHCHAGDTIGVLLDCDAGRLSFFFDGVKYGEHILNDLGCAFENISPFGFNADGCGGGGAGQGAPSGEGGRGGRYPANGTVRPKALWPVIGLRHPGDRVTISHKWMTNYGVDGSTMLRNAMLVDEVLQSYCFPIAKEGPQVVPKDNSLDSIELPKWIVQESFAELKRWEEGKWCRSATRANGPMNLPTSGLNIDIDVSPQVCAAACANLGLKFVLLPGDKVCVKRSAGRILELLEEAEILGAFSGKLWYQIVSQKSEGGSLKEGGGRAWFWDESEVVAGGLQLVVSRPANEIVLPLLDRFKCTARGGLRITYSSGAIMRADIEILEHVSQSIGVIPDGTVIPREDIIERRLNSSGLVRFLVKYEPIGTGWISYRIRGGNEEAVVELIDAKDSDSFESSTGVSISCPFESAKIWFKEYTNLSDTQGKNIDTANNCWEAWKISSSAEFEGLLKIGVVQGMTYRDSDSLLSQIVTSISDHTKSGSALDCRYESFSAALFHALKAHNRLHPSDISINCPTPESSSHQLAATKISTLSGTFPSMKALLARVALLRALNRRAKYALPLYSIRPPQEDSGIIGGLAGFGASVERLGKSRKSASLASWVQASSIGKRIRDCRQLLFTSMKRDMLNSVVDVTTTPTSLSHDEYELPRDIRTVRVNRLKARKAFDSAKNDFKRENTVFGQLQTELRGWSSSALRRGYVAKGHGGQKRAFKVKLIGEGVNDYSGPYREVFTDAIREVNPTMDAEKSTLNILAPSPNNKIGVGECRDLCIFSSIENTLKERNIPESFLSEEEQIIRSHYSSHIVAKSEKKKSQEEALAFLGKLMATAVRHGIPVDVDLPLCTVWNCLCEEDFNALQSLQEIDLIEYKRLKEGARSNAEKASELDLFIEQQQLFNAFAVGISGILPVEIFSIFTGIELRDYFCGNTEIDVELLRKVVEYEGYEEKDDVVTYFWETLREMTTEEKKLFLQFVWARSRMPQKESDFEAPFKIQKDTKIFSHDALPSASTCFFSLTLPEYKSKEILREKLLFAIKNVTTMESDYVTNDIEIGEGWRGI